MIYPSSTITVMVDASRKISGMIMRDYYELQLLQNSRNSLFGFYDHLARRAVPKLRDELLKVRPGFAVDVGEISEGDAWVFNVLEGKNNFLHALPHFAISIAHVNKTNSKIQVMSGLIVMPALNEMFFAEHNKGAWFERFDMNQDKLDKLHVSGRKAKADLLCAVNGNTPFYEVESLNFGSNAVALSYLSAGRVDAVIIKGYEYRDIAAGLLIATEAGAMVDIDEHNIFASTQYFRSQYNH